MSWSDPEVKRQYMKAYREKRRDELKARQKEWMRLNKATYRAKALARHQRRKDEAFTQYGGYECAHCHIQDPRCLTLDHVNNDGAAHRRSMGSKGGGRLYEWLHKNRYPSGFQVLCMNCQWIKYHDARQASRKAAA